MSIFILALNLFFAPSFASADELDVIIAKLEKHKKGLQETYHDYIDKIFMNSIYWHYSMASYDHGVVANVLLEQTNEDHDKVLQKEIKFREIQEEINESPQEMPTHLPILLSIQSQLQELLHRANKRSQDFPILDESWKNYCLDENIQATQRFNDPLATFSPDMLPFSLPSFQVPIQVEVGVTFGSNGEVASVNGNINSYDTSGTGGVAAIGATVGTAMLLKYAAWKAGEAAASSVVCGPYAPICAGVIIVGTIIYELVTLSNKTGEMVDKQNRILELQQEIHDIQVDAITQLSSRSFQKTKDVCGIFFSTQKKLWTVDGPLLHKQKLDQLSQEINQYIDSDLPQAYAEHLIYLEQVYYPELLEGYLDSIQAHYQDQQILREEIVQFATQNIGPKLENLANQSQSLKQWVTKHQVWNDIIVGDALYLEQEGYSFYPLSNEISGGVQLSNIWEQLSSSILQEVQK